MQARVFPTRALRDSLGSSQALTDNSSMNTGLQKLLSKKSYQLAAVIPND